MKFGKKLQELRIKAGYRQPEAAKIMGIEQSYLSKLENNRAIPSREMFEKIINVYQLTPEQMFQGVDPTSIYQDFDHIPWVAEKLQNFEKKTLSYHIRWLLIATVTYCFGILLIITSISGLVLPNKQYTYSGLYAFHDPSAQFSQTTFTSHEYLGHFVHFGKFIKPIFMYQLQKAEFFMRIGNRWMLFIGLILTLAGLGFAFFSRYIRLRGL